MCDSPGVLDFVVCLVDTILNSAGQVNVFRVKFEKLKWFTLQLVFKNTCHPSTKTVMFPSQEVFVIRYLCIL